MQPAVTNVRPRFFVIVPGPFAIAPFAVIPVAVGISVHAVAVIRAIQKLAFIPVALSLALVLGKCQHTVAVHLVIAPLAFIPLTIWPSLHAVAIILAIAELALITFAIRESEDTLAVPLVHRETRRHTGGHRGKFQRGELRPPVDATQA